MSRSSRTTLMWVLLIVLVATLFLGNIGTVEVLIWFGLLAAWVTAFFTWARRGPHAG